MKKIVFIGPESTGKTTLAIRLASEYGCVYVEEYSRSYVIEEGRELTFDDVMPIVRGQISAECSARGELIHSGIMVMCHRNWKRHYRI